MAILTYTGTPLLANFNAIIDDEGNSWRGCYYRPTAADVLEWPLL